MSSVEELLLSKGVKPTAMRLLVMQFFIKRTDACSLKEIEDYFDRSDMSTLYRTLKTFTKHNLLHTIDDGSGTMKYAKCVDGCICAPEDLHFHFHCTSCGRTSCLTDQRIPMVQLPTSYKMTEANMVVKGLCAGCS